MNVVKIEILLLVFGFPDVMIENIHFLKDSTIKKWKISKIERNIRLRLFQKWWILCGNTN